MITALLLGSALGFFSAVPVAGPVSAVIFSRGMRAKYAQGRWIALGAGLVEGAYSFLAFWGFNHFLAHLSFILVVSNALAAVILGALGIYFFRSKKMRKAVTHSNLSATREKTAFLTGVGMSAINPSLIATWTAAITTLFSMKLFEFSDSNSILFSAGVATGIVAWFSLLMSTMKKHRGQMKPSVLDKCLKAIGTLLIGLALGMVYRLFKGQS